MVTPFKFKDGTSVTKKKKAKKPKISGVESRPGKADSETEATNSNEKDDTKARSEGEKPPLSPKSEEQLGRDIAAARSSNSASKSSRSAARSTTPLMRPMKTEAERQWEERQVKNMLERAKRDGFKTHEQRVREFNEDLERRTEHNDMPKIGPG